MNTLFDVAAWTTMAVFVVVALLLCISAFAQDDRAHGNGAFTRQDGIDGSRLIAAVACLAISALIFVMHTFYG